MTKPWTPIRRVQITFWTFTGELEYSNMQPMTIAELRELVDKIEAIEREINYPKARAVTV